MSTVEEHYEQFLAAHYTWMSGGHEAQVEKNRRMLAEFGFDAPPCGKALDLGCGSGYQSLALAEQGFQVIAVDLSQQLLDELCAIATGTAVIAVPGDMLSSETYRMHGPFDAVVCMGDTLIHVQSVEEVKQLFVDIHTHMKHGGKLLLSFRDLSTELQGIDRVIPVRMDEHQLMATFLEYAARHVTVHDILFTRPNGEWEMAKSAYRKLRLSGDEAAAMLIEAGFMKVDRRSDRGFTVIAAEKPSESPAVA